MQAEDSRIKSLHQEASSHYLRGEFRQALDVWRSVLELRSEDERAQEGVRLCEMLVEEGAPQAAEPPSNPPPAQAGTRPPFAEAAEGFDDDLEELDEILESGLGSSPAREAAQPESDKAPESRDGDFFEFSNVPGAEEPLQTGSESAGSAPVAEKIDFGDLCEAESVPADGAPQEAMAIERHSHAVDLPEGGEPAGEAAVDETQAEESSAENEAAKAEAQEAAAAELRSRVNELLAEALTAYEQDRKEEALAVLNRIFILDENNHAALALHDNIRVELEAEQAANTDLPETVTPKEGDEAAATLDLAAGQADELPPVEDAHPESDREAEETRSPGAESQIMDDFDELDESEAALAAGGQKRRWFGEDLLTRQNVILFVTLVVVVCVGGFLAYTFMGGSDGSSASEGNAAAAMAGAGPVAPAVAVVLSEGGEETEPASAAATPEASAPSEPAAPPQDPELLARRLENLIEQARQAMQREDWAAAVLAYNQALEIDPANVAVRDELAEAGDRYREERALEQRHQQAIEAFNDGNYRAALTLFYRLPSGGEDGQRIERYKRNGWYNMGIQALAVGDCKSATTHLTEARGVDPQDHETLLALELAKSCPYSRDTDAYRDEVRQMPLRGLDD